MANTSGGSSMDGATGGNKGSRNGGQRVISSSHSGSDHMTKVPSARRRAHPPTRFGSEVPEPSRKKRKVVNEEEAPCGVSNGGKISASSSAASRDPNGTSSSEDHAGGYTSEYATVGNARGSPIKRRCMRTSHYLGLFTYLKKKRTDEVVKSKQSTVPTKTNKVKECQFQKLQRLPDGSHPDFDNDHLCSVNKLLEFRHKSQGAVFVDDKEHVMKTIFFISSVLPDACHSFLLVTTTSLPLWKAEFNRFAPSINVVAFDGEKNVLKLIQNPEFHENGNHTMPHVLLAHPDVILEDIKSVEGIVWESVIVDYCEDSVAKHLKQLKQLPTDFRMVLLSSPLKDSLPEYKKLLDFLNSEREDSGDYIEADSLAMLRARFTRYIAYERKADSSIFLEYWVPAYLSQVQLELYSSILLANSSVLQSQMTTDSVGPLCDIVMSLWKCCNHPCLIDQQHSLANTPDITESTDDRMRVSGKLLLLEKMLKEMRNKNLRVIVLFQSDGAVGDRMGNILEDLMRHKFGPESYERVQNRSAFAMKQEAMNMFNDTTKGRFVFLIDSRACQPSINLSSIDSIIIYDSDLNPLNDLKALRKIKIGSQLKYVRIFRLYTPFTVEEKSLVLAKQSMIIDSKSLDIISSVSHCLVSWGVSFLFNRVDELQQDNCASKSNERGTIFMDKVLLELLTVLSTEVEDSSKVNRTTISKACMSGEFYSRNITLIGEREGVSSLDGDPPNFWLNSLDGRSYCQRYKPVEVTTEEKNTSRRKRRSTCEIADSSSKFQLDVINHDVLPEISTTSSADLHLLPATGVENVSTPKSLHAELKRELSKLMMVLKLPDNVLFLANQFLEYFLNNHLVVREPRGILHAFNIALCWHAASFVKYTKLDRRESLALASDGLNYECNEELAKIFYKKIGILKEKVAHKPGERINDRLSPHESSSANLRIDHNFLKEAMDLHGNFTNGTEDSPSAAEQMVMVSDEQELVSAPDADREQHLLSEESPNSAAMKRIDLFNSIFSSRERDIIEKQQLEMLNLRTQRDNQVKKLKEVCHAVVRHIRTSNIDEEMKIDQIKLVIQWFTMFMLSFLAHMRLQFFKLDALHSTTLAKEELMKEKLKQEVISGELDQFPDPCVTLPDSNSVVEEFIHFVKQNGDSHVDKNLALDGDQILDDKSMEITIVRSSFSPEACPTLAVRNEPTEGHMRSGGRAASEPVDLPDNNNHCSSDGIDYQRACSASSIPTSHDSINQESSTGDGRSIEHVKGDNIANPSMFPGSATSLVGINAEFDSTVAADPDHLESPILASPQNVTTLQHQTAEEPSDTLLAMAAQDLQTEMQTTCPTLGAQHQKVCLDDSSKMNHEPYTTTGMLQEVTSSDHLGDSSKMNVEPNTTGVLQEGTISDHLDDSSTGVKEKNIDAVTADPLNSENQSCIATNNPAVVPEAWVAETQSDHSSMPAQHSTSLPAQQKLPIVGHPPEEAGPSSNLDKEAAQQPDIQPSSSTLDVGINAEIDSTVAADPDHLESPILASPQNVTTLQHPTAEEPSDTLLAMAAQDLQTEMQTTCPTLGAQHQVCPDDSSKMNHEPYIATGMLQEVISSDHLGDSSKMNVEPDTTTGVLQEGTISDHLGDSSTGVKEKNIDTVTADPLNSENQSYIAPNNLDVVPEAWVAETQSDHSSMPAQHSTSLRAQQKLPIVGHPPEEAGPSSNLDKEAAQQPDIQPSSSTLDADSSETRHQSETTTVLSQGGSKNHDVDNDGTVHAQKAHLESPILAAPQSPEAWVAETQSDHSIMPAQHSTSLPAQQKLPILGHSPEEAGPSSNLDTEAAQQPDIQPSSSTLDADSSETRHQSQTTTVLSQGSSKNHDVDNDGTVHAQKDHSESPILAAPQSPAMLSLPLETGTPANLSSTSSLQSNDASSRHTPAVSESPGMLGTQAEQDLHPDTRPSTSLLGVPFQRMFPDDRSQTGCRPDRGTDLSEEGETECLTCTTSNLPTLPFSGEAETENGQESTPAQEITSPHAQHSLATSQHPVGDLQPPTLILSEEAERAGLLCTSAPQDLQASSPLQDQLAEAGAGISVTIPAQNLEPETQPSTSAQHIPPERTHPDERIQTGLQPNTTSGPEQLAQLSTVVPAGLLCSSEPLINELEKLKYRNAVLSKNHEQKKSQLQTECNQEIEKVKEKYELLLQEEDSAYHRLTTDLNRIYMKVSVHQSLAECFREKFLKASPVQGRSASPTIWQAPPSSQHALYGTTAAQTTLLPVDSSLGARPQVLTSSQTTGPYLQPSQVARPPASGAIQLQPVLPGNLSRAAPSPVGSMPPRNGTYGAVGAQTRGPAPHLQQLRMPAPYAMVRRDEQQPSTISPGVIPSRQSAPGMFESSASGSASTAPSSVQQAMPSASNSHPAFPPSSLLPGLGPESMANIAQSYSRIPAAMASQQAPGQNPAFHHMGGGPLNTASGIQQARAHIGGTAQAAPDQSQEVLRRLLRQFPQVMAPSSVQTTASSSHLAPMSAARQQAGFSNPAPENMAGPLNVSAGVQRPVARVGNQFHQVSAALLEWEAALRVGMIRGHQGTYPQGQGGSDLTGGPPGTSPQGSSGASREVVCLSDDDEE